MYLRPMNHEPKFRLGQVVKDQLTGFEGTVTSMTEWANNCPRYTIRPNKLKDDGTLHESRGFDVTFLEKVDAPTPLERDYPQPTSGATLGDVVGDNNTDLRGTVIAMSYDINGCVGYYVQPRELTRDHKVAECQLLWDLDVHIVKPTEKPKKAVTTGGDRPEPKRQEPKSRG